MLHVISKACGLYCITLYHSYSFEKSEFDEVLDILTSRYPMHFVIQTRTRISMKRELATHIFLYNIGYKITRTMHTDFNSPLSFWEKIGYNVLGRLCMLFIK